MKRNSPIPENKTREDVFYQMLDDELFPHMPQPDTDEAVAAYAEEHGLKIIQARRIVCYRYYLQQMERRVALCGKQFVEAK